LTVWGPVTLVVLISAMSGRCENDGERRGLKSPPAKVALSVGGNDRLEPLSHATLRAFVAVFRADREEEQNRCRISR
jgi:hypothetical protein